MPTRPSADPHAGSPAAPAVWTWPLILAVASAIGLVSALVVDGWGDAGAWLGLGLPLAVIAWHLRRR